jgi:hypothetical protein
MKRQANRGGIEFPVSRFEFRVEASGIVKQLETRNLKLETESRYSWLMIPSGPTLMVVGTPGGGVP